MRRPPLWGLALALPLLASPWLGAADAQWRVWFFQWRGARPLAAVQATAGRAAALERVPVLLAVDRESLALDQLLSPAEREASPLWRRMGAWPWPRALQAELAAAVLERGAARVVFNIVTSQPSRYGPADDQAFVRRLAPWRQRVVLAASLGSSEQAGLAEQQLQRPLYGDFPRVGLTALLQSPQGITEAIPGRRWLEQTLADFPPPHPLPLAFAALGRPAPAEPLAINYPGPAGSLPQVPAWQVLEQPAGFWGGRTVLFGATAAELGDQQETPYGPQSGAEVQAAALASLLQGTAQRQLPAPVVVVLLLGWLLLAGLLLRRGGNASVTLSLALTIASGGLLLAGVSWSTGWLLPVTALVAAPLVGGAVRGGGQWLRESRERAYLHQVLARRISPTLLRDILREPGPLWTQVGGTRARCVVLFTDLVGFTPLSAELEPTELFALLNRYFESIAAAVIEEQGLLDKFIGDSLMAEFGVPRSRGDREEALAAVRAALAMRAGLETLNGELERSGRPRLRQGIGLHFGEVFAGNLGSSQRLEFTVVGATVNVASRLEGLNRSYPEHPILISGELLALVGDRLQVVPLGPHRVKGWPTPLEVYALLALLEED
ncbi:MAG: adenylate/guanylate cyclase domain-containing protein [Synechococcaceae cyanobacterium ELA445]